MSDKSMSDFKGEFMTDMTSRGEILLVDDDPGFLKLLSMRLEHEKFNVSSVTSGQRALDYLNLKMPDIVVTDLKMDMMDGMMLLSEIRKCFPSLPVIIITAHGTIPEAVEATQKGVYGFIQKPVNKDELIREIDKAIALSGKEKVHDMVRVSLGSECILTRNAAMLDLLSQARRVGMTDASVHIFGESGTGKELLAKYIHQASPRKDKPFVALNCAAMPHHLLESELFGHVKGAFTGAVKDSEGIFQGAYGGTLFLDEIGDMPPPLQAKLLRALQEKTVKPVGSHHSIPVDVRIISATHKDLDKAIVKGDFREDLYYRLKVVTLEIPRLTNRPEDILLLADYFLKRFSKSQHGSYVLAPGAMELLIQAPWPGNIRQLCNVIEEAVALSPTPVIAGSLIQKSLKLAQEHTRSLQEARAEFDRNYLVDILKRTEGNILQSARLAGRNRTEFYKLLSRHNIDASLYKKMRVCSEKAE